MKSAAALCLIACAALAQPQFEVASVRIGALPPTGVIGMTSGGPGTDRPERFSGRLVTLQRLIEIAYDVRYFQVEGPGWIRDQDARQTQYDIAVILDKDATKEQFRLMMQNLLAERFHLRFHRVTKVLPAYELVIANGGTKLKESNTTDRTMRDKVDDRPYHLPPGSVMTTPTKGGVQLGSAAIPIAKIIPYLQPHLENYQLIDKTGLTGKYDIFLEFAPESAYQRRIAMELSGITSDEGFVFPSLSTALQEQLGLRLVKGAALFEMFVVDSADKVPTEN